MKRDEIKKFFKSKTKLLLYAFIAFVIAIVMILVGDEIDNKKITDIPKDYNELIAKGEDKNNTYAEVTIVYAIKFAVNDDSNLDYYFVQDKDGYTFVARITKETYQKLKELADKDPDNFEYKLKGYIYNIGEDVKNVAINSFEDCFGTKIDKSNYEDYLGKTYLDETVKPSSKTVGILIGIGVGLLVLSIILIICYIVDTISYKKNVRKYDVKLLKEEMLKDSTKYYKKENIYLTDNNIISRVNGFKVISYDNILWAYHNTLKTYGFTVKNSIVVYTKNHKTYEVASNTNDSDGLLDILNEIHNKNENILIGFSKENQDKIKEIKKEDKKSKK